MKKFVIATIAAAMLTTPALAAPGHDNGNRGGRYEQNHRDTRVVKKTIVRRSHVQQNHRWNKGDRFDRRQARNYRVISSPRAYRLNDAPRGYRWVQSGNDAVLVGINSGVVAAIMANMIR